MVYLMTVPRRSPTLVESIVSRETIPSMHNNQVVFQILGSTRVTCLLSTAYAHDDRHVRRDCKSKTCLKGPAAAQAQAFRQTACVVFAVIP